LSRQQATNLELGRDTSRVNQMVNGGFEIWQRGNGPFTGAYSADRYYVGVAGTDTVSVTRNTATVDAGSKVSMQVAYTRVIGGSNIYQQLMATDGHQLGGRTLSASVRVRAGVAGHCYLLFTATGTGVVGVQSAFHPGGNTWQTLTCPALFVPTDFTYVLFEIVFSQTDTLYFDNAMIVMGNQPADYVPLPPADDLARCLRYYQQTPPGAIWIIQGYGAAGQVWYHWLPTQVRMAVAPTATKVGTFGASNCNQPTIYSTDPAGITFYCTATALGSYFIQASASAYYTLEANP
jgi:hypothetical protein